MIGRGAEGRPWRLAQISSDLFGTPYAEPPAEQKLASMLEQVRGSVALYGERLGVRVVRKHIAAFVDAWCADYGLTPMNETRVALCRIESSAMLMGQLEAALGARKAAA
jgi:tRNA-dihydrouridine synthase